MTTQHHNPKHHNPDLHQHRNLKIQRYTSSHSCYVDITDDRGFKKYENLISHKYKQWKTYNGVKMFIKNYQLVQELLMGDSQINTWIWFFRNLNFLKRREIKFKKWSGNRSNRITHTSYIFIPCTVDRLFLIADTEFSVVFLLARVNRLM